MNSDANSSIEKVRRKRVLQRRVVSKAPRAPIAKDGQRQHKFVSVFEIAAIEAINQGLSAGDLYRLVDQALIRAAVGTIGNARHKPNQSQIAAQTGLTRPEVRSLVAQSKPDFKQFSPIRRNKVSQTYEYLAVHHLAKRSRAQPFTVRYEGRGRSFTNAVRAVGGDIPAAAILKEFVRRGLAQVVRRDSKPHSLVIRPRFEPSENTLGFCLADGVSKATNSEGDLHGKGTHLFETVCYSELAMRQFSRLLEQKSEAFFDSLGAVRAYADKRPNKGVRKTARRLRVALVYWNDVT
jgi:DNA-binding phage protein